MNVADQRLRMRKRSARRVPSSRRSRPIARRARAAHDPPAHCRGPARGARRRRSRRSSRRGAISTRSGASCALSSRPKRRPRPAREAMRRPCGSQVAEARAAATRIAGHPGEPAEQLVVGGAGDRARGSAAAPPPAAEPVRVEAAGSARCARTVPIVEVLIDSHRAPKAEAAAAATTTPTTRDGARRSAHRAGRWRGRRRQVGRAHAGRHTSMSGGQRADEAIALVERFVDESTS